MLKVSKKWQIATFRVSKKWLNATFFILSGGLFRPPF